MDDLEKLKADFLAEACEHMETVEDDILALEEQGKDFDQDVINHLFRAIHSIKGTSGFFEYNNITDLSHSLESVIDNIRNHKLNPTENICETLLNGTDKLKSLIDDVENQSAIDITAELTALKQLLASPIIDNSPPPPQAEKKAEPKKVEPKKQKAPPEKPKTADFSYKPKKEKKTTTQINLQSYFPSENGHYTHTLTLDLIAECDHKNRLLTELIEHIAILGNVTEISFDNDQFDDSNNGTTNRLLCSIVLSTVIEDPELLYESLEISPLISAEPASRVNEEEILPLNYKPPSPAPEQPSIETTQEETLDIDNAPAISQAENEVELSHANAPVSHPPQKEDEAPVATPPEQPENKDLPVPPSTEEEKNAPSNKNTKSVKKAAASTLRIPLTLLDKLMNLASELVLVRNEYIQFIETGNIEQLRGNAKKLNVVTSGLQASIMQTRMQPVDTVFSKFTRIVRDLSKKLKKETELELIGRDVELDKNILEAISDPLTHLIRNAVDHGIESPEHREMHNKNRKGKIILSAFYQAGQVNIKIQDDGKGMDPEKIKASAIKKGMITEQEAQNYSKQDTFGLIFRPGFSTASAVTDVSGRGVGMDVVKTNFQKLGGMIEINSQINKGTTFEIKLPLTLTIMQALIVSVENIYFSIPEYNISEVVWLYGEDIYKHVLMINNQEVFSLRGKLIPVLRLGQILKIQSTYLDPVTNIKKPDKRVRTTDRRNDDSSPPEDAPFENERRQTNAGRRNSLDNSIYILILKLGSFQFGLIVDSIIDTEEVVVKPLHNQIKDCRPFSGTTVLGNGRIAMILDIVSLAELGTFNINQIENDSYKKQDSLEDKQTVIQFNVGGREIFALPLFLINHIEQIKTDDIMIANNKEYVQFKEQLVPVIRLENVLESTDGNYFDTFFIIIIKGNKPIGILASQIVDTTIIGNNFETATAVKPGIIGGMIINNEITLVLDVFKIIELAEPAWFKDNKLLSTGKKRLLLVEDTVFYTSLIKSFLQGTNVEVVVAKNGQEGIKALKEDGEFNVIISDLEMPLMDGFEFAAYVKAKSHYKDIPLIAISSKYNDTDGKRITIEAGFDNYVSKLNRDAMLTTLKNILM